MRRCGIAIALALALALFGTNAGAAPKVDKGGSADLAVTNNDSPDPVTAGTTLTYTISVQNLGPDQASGVTVTDQLAKGVDFVSASASSGTCEHKGRRATCQVGQLGTPTIDYSPTTVTLAVIPRRLGVIGNTASVKGDQKDPVGSNDKATATTTVVGPPATCRGVPATITGTAGRDFIVGTPGPDVIATFRGNDTIASLGGRDLVCAGSGSDYVGAGTAGDRVFGGAGGDRLLGRGGPDLLKGEAGADVLKGQRGRDRLRGGRGFDRCRGGGADSVRGCER